MRRFQLIIPTQKAKVDLLYNTDGSLRRIDFTSMVLEPNKLRWFINRIATDIEFIKQGFEGYPVTVTEAELDITFEDFIREYPYKRNTHLAAKFWPNMTSAQQLQAYYAAIDYRKHLEKPVNNWKNPKIANAWLKDKEYLNNWNEL